MISFVGAISFVNGAIPRASFLLRHHPSEKEGDPSRRMHDVGEGRPFTPNVAILPTNVPTPNIGVQTAPVETNPKTRTSLHAEHAKDVRRAGTPQF